MAGRGKIPHRKHGPPSQRVPMKGRSLEELEAIIHRNEARARPAETAGAKQARRKIVGGRKSGEVRSAHKEVRYAQIRSAHADLVQQGVSDIRQLLCARFDISPSTLRRALIASRT